MTTDQDGWTEDMRHWAASIDKAHAEVARMCSGPDSHHWRMSIPARPDRDSDLIISAGLEAGQVAIAALAAIRREVHQWTTKPRGDTP